MTKAALRTYIETYIKNSSVEAFTNLRLQTALLEMADDALSSSVGDAANTTALQLLSGADFTYVIVTGSGIYEYSSTGTANGTTIFAATGGGTWNQIFSGGSGGGTWGSITGTLSAQTDLQSALDAKQDAFAVITSAASGDSLEYNGTDFVNVNKASTVLSGTSWDGSNKYKTSLSGNLALNLSSTKVAGLLVIEDNNNHTLTINGTNIPINATTATVIGFHKANGVYYIVDKDGLTIHVSGPDVVAPTFTFEAIDANTLRGTASESMGTVSIAGFSFKQNGTPITPDSVSGATTQWDFVVSETLISSDTLLWSYDSSTGATVDLAGNELATATDQSVTNSISSYDSDAAAYITAASVSAGTHADAVDAFVVALKGASLWTKTKAFYPLYGTAISQAKYNLVNPLDTDGAFRLTEAGTFTYSNGAVKASGADSDGLNTHLNPNNAAIGQDDNCTFVSVKAGISQTKCAFGSFPTTNSHYIVPRMSGDVILIGNNCAGNNSTSNTNAVARYYNSRLVSTEFKHYKNGTLSGTVTTVSSTPDNTPFYIFNSGNGGLGVYIGTVSMAGVFVGLTAGEITTLDGLISTLETALGR